MERTSVLIGWILGSPFLILFLHILVARLNKKSSPQIVCVTTLIFSYLPVGVLYFRSLFHEPLLSWDRIFFGGLYFLIVYSGIVYSYFSIFHLNDSRRIKMLLEIYDRTAVRLPELLALYNPKHVFEFRLQRMVDSGQLSCQEGLYRLKGKALYYFSSAIMFWRALIGFESIEARMKRIDRIGN